MLVALYNLFTCLLNNRNFLKPRSLKKPAVIPTAALLITLASQTVAQSNDYPDQEYADPEAGRIVYDRGHGTTTHVNFASAEDACKSWETPTRSLLRVEYGPPSTIPGRPPSGICIFTNEPSFGIPRPDPYCVKSDGGWWNENDRLSWYECFPMYPPYPQCQGNPIEALSGAKLEFNLDWISPKESRFKVSRAFNSQNPTWIEAGSYISGIGWTPNWGLRFLGTRTLYTETGRSEYFPKSTKSGDVDTPQGLSANRNFSQNPISRRKSVAVDKRFETSIGGFTSDKASITNSDGSIYIFGNQNENSHLTLANTNLPILKQIWPDGYEITYTYEDLVSGDLASGRLIEFADNRGQVARFTWNTVTSGPVNYRRASRVSKIEIDTDFDGVTFTPEISLDYSYITIQEDGGLFALDEVILTDNAAGSSKTLWKYLTRTDNDYQTRKSPQLLSVFNANDPSLPYSSFQYDDDKAIQTELGNGLNKIEVTYGINSSVVKNPYGLNTTFSLGSTTIGDRTIGAMSSVVGEQTPHCLGTVTSIGYTPSSGEISGPKYEQAHKNGAITRYTRDLWGNILTKTEDAEGITPRVTTYTWHSDYNIPTSRQTSELREEFTYDADGLLIEYKQIDVLSGSPDNGSERVWGYFYNTLPTGLKVLAYMDGPGLLSEGVYDVTSFEYDAEGKLTKVTDPVGLETLYGSFNALGQPQLVTEPNGMEYGFTYDIEGRVLTSTINPNTGDPKTTSFEYDPIGQLIKTTNSLGKSWEYTYDAAKRLIQIKDAVGETIQFEHDLAGNVTKTKHVKLDGTVRFYEDVTYDELGRVREILGAKNQVWDHDYDVEDDLIKITDPANHQIQHSYDALQRVVSTIDRAGGTIQTDHNDADQLTQFEDQRTLTTGFTYNGFGDVVEETSPDRGTMSYVYDTRGLVSSMTDARGVVSNYSYDNAGRLLSKSYPSSTAENLSFQYDFATATNPRGVGQLTQVNHEFGWTKLRYRNLFGDKYYELHDIEGTKYSVQAFENAEGFVNSVHYPSGRHFSISRDGNNRITKIRTRTKNANGSWNAYEDVVKSIQYEPQGPLRRVFYGDGTKRWFIYDQSFRLTQIIDREPDNTLFAHKIYSNNLRDDLTQISDQFDPAAQESFTYNSRQMLATATGPYGDLMYDYDAVGNRTHAILYIPELQTTDGIISNIASDSNRLNGFVGPIGGTEYGYDAAGNVTVETRHGPTGVNIHNYTYNAANRLASLSINGAIQADYGYNHLGQQIIRRLTQDNKTIHNIFDFNGNRIAEYEIDNATGDQTLLREYVWVDDLPVAVIEGGEVYYIRTDHIGRPSFATDSVGTEVWSVKYLPFGGVHVETGDPINLRFPGQWFQAETGLYQNWMRDYDPTTGRYIQADPLGLIDGPAVYNYAMQSPNRYVDPRGEFVPFAFGAVRLGVAGYRLYKARKAALALAAVTGAAMQDAKRGKIEDLECDDPCAEHYAKINRLTVELMKRFRQWRKNKGKFTPGQKGFYNHSGEIFRKQLALERAIKKSLLDGCINYNRDADRMVNREIPFPGFGIN